MQGISGRLQFLREHAGISGRELDRLAGLGEGHVRLIETGERPRIESATAMKLAATLGVSLDWLIAGRGAPPTRDEVAKAVASARRRAA